MCGQQKGQNRAKSHVTDIFKKCFFGCHFSFLKRAGRHQKGAGRRTLQKRPRQNTEKVGPPRIEVGNVILKRWVLIYVNGVAMKVEAVMVRNEDL